MFESSSFQSKKQCTIQVELAHQCFSSYFHKLLTQGAVQLYLTILSTPIVQICVCSIKGALKSNLLTRSPICKGMSRILSIED